MKCGLVLSLSLSLSLSPHYTHTLTSSLSLCQLHMCYSPVHTPTERHKYDFWFCTQVSLLGKFLSGIYIHGFDRFSGFDRSTSADCHITDHGGGPGGGQYHTSVLALVSSPDHTFYAISERGSGVIRRFSWACGATPPT